QDLSRRRVVTEAIGDGCHRADRRVVEASLEPDYSECGVAVRDSDPELKVVPAFLPPLGKLVDATAHRDCHPNCTNGAVGTGERIVEEDHQPVAGEALERALEPDDQVT